METTSQKFRPILFRYRKALSKILNPFDGPLRMLFLIAPDGLERYAKAAKEVTGNTLLDVGAGGKSFFSLRWSSCLSVDVKKLPGVDIVASVTYLPFVNGAFDTVLSMDTLEHVPFRYRSTAKAEIVRVAKLAALIHCPLEDGKMYRARDCDAILNRWLEKITGRRDPSLQEHEQSTEPSPNEFTDSFSLTPTHSCKAWLTYMQMEIRFFWPLGVLLAHISSSRTRQYDSSPPFWGGLAVLRKHGSLS
jgi:hypothetical protein